MLMELTAEQQARIQRLLEEELREACHSARDRGAGPAEIHDLVAGRRRALEQLLTGLADKTRDPAEQPRDGGG